MSDLERSYKYLRPCVTFGKSCNYVSFDKNLYISEIMVGCQMVLFILQPEGLKFKVTMVLLPAPHMSAKGNPSR